MRRCAYLLSQRVGELNVIRVAGGPQAQRVRDVNRPSRPGLVLQAPQVRLDVAAVHLQLALVRERDLLDALVAAGTQDHDAHGPVRQTQLERRMVLYLDHDALRIAVRRHH